MDLYDLEGVGMGGSGFRGASLGAGAYPDLASQIELEQFASRDVADADISEGSSVRDASKEETTIDEETQLQTHKRFGEDDENDKQQQRRKQGNVIWVHFETHDKENPFNFSLKFKYLLTALAMLFTFETASTASAYVPGIKLMEQDLNVTNRTLSLAGISVYAFGFGIPPLFLAPLSEVYGRRWVLLVSHLAYTLFFFCVGFADNIATVLLGRFFGGAFGSTGSTLTGGLLADIFVTSERGTPMALFATAAIAGTGFGPVWAGWVAQRPDLSWRWIQYIQLISSAGSLLALCVCLKETRGSVILTRRAARLRRQTGDQRYKAHVEEERQSISVLIRQSLTRPMLFLLREPAVLSFSLWISTLWSVMYSLLESIGLVTALHGYSPGQNGLVFLSIVVAAFFGLAINTYQNRLYQRNVKIRGPEARLYMSLVAAPMFPAGCLIYGWTSYAHVPIEGPIVGIVVLMTAVHIVYLAAFNYLADNYLLFASSALAAQSFARNMFCFAVPLFATNIYENLGYQWASSLAGFLGLVLGVVPYILFFYGKEIRRRSPASQHLQKLERLRVKQQQVKS